MTDSRSSIEERTRAASPSEQTLAALLNKATQLNALLAELRRLPAEEITTAQYDQYDGLLQCVRGFAQAFVRLDLAERGE